jgi:hypothetical protein
MPERAARTRLSDQGCQNWAAWTALPGQYSQDRTKWIGQTENRTGQVDLDKYCRITQQNWTGRTGQAEKHRQNKTGRKRKAEQDCQDRTAKTGLPG